MPPALKDAIVIVLDVGKSVSTLHYWEDNTFFDQARDCVSWIIQRKIISESSDVLSLLLIGSEESDKSIAENGYKNIKTQYDFQLASWEMLKFIEDEIKTSKIESDWLGGLIVSMEMLKSYEETTHINNKKIVFFSDFTHPASDDLDVVIRSIKAINIEITIIGPEHFCLENEIEENSEEPLCKKKKGNEKSTERQGGEKLVKELWTKFKDNVRICTSESALKQLCSHISKPRRVTPWNCIFDIGDVKINISLLKKTDSKTSKSFSSKCVKPFPQNPSTASSSQVTSSKETIPAIRDKVLQYKHETGIGNEILNVEVKEEDTIEGYRYGTTVIPFSDEDKAAFRFKSGPKCFSLIGFTNITSVPYYLLSGDSSYIVVPRNKDKNSERALSAVIQGMKKMECLGIVRRVYSDNSGLSLGILYPVVEEIVCDETDEVSYKEYLLFVELAFEEDVKAINFPSLEDVTKNITKDQYHAVDKLIDEMNLMKAEKGLRGEPCEAFDLPNLHDVKKQFLHYCIIQRGLHPDRPIPTSLPPFIENFIRIPKSIEENCKSLVKDLEKEFKIKKDKLATDDSYISSSPQKSETHLKNATASTSRRSIKDTTEHYSETSVSAEGDPVKKIWKKLFAKSFPTDSELDQFFEEYMKNYKSKECDFLNAFQYVFFEIRSMYLKINPDAFNCWMEKFKNYVRNKDGIEVQLWGIIVAENLGLISERENKYSNVPEEDAEEFLCESVTKSASCCTPKKPKPDFGPSPECLNELEAESARKQNDMTSNGAHLEMTSTSPSPPVTSENVSTSPQTVVIKGRRYRQRQLGPAPFASFEDLSDELESPPETARIPLPGIKEDPSSQIQSPNTPLPLGVTVQLTSKEEQGLKDALTSSLDTPAPPRIDISRASSSSQHEDSITSSPERENGTHNLGYKEDGTVDLRSSTEELDYIQEPGTVQESEEKRKREKMMKRQQQVRDFCDTQSQYDLMERKDSSCSVMSDVGLLCISGRTSRLSSIGSAASGGSVASGTSHLSAGSHLSGRSTRSPSPHKMQLETSFCGNRLANSQVIEAEVPPTVSGATDSRPPSRLRSRSPSPHKMLLETSFCGTKQLPPSGTKTSNDLSKSPKKTESQMNPSAVTETEIIVEKAPKQEAVKAGGEKDAEKEERPKVKADEIKRVEKSMESIKLTKKTKTITLPKKAPSKPKKIISIRDIPGDEIFIPLKGPELDLEEIIRKASPNLKKKTEGSKPSSDEIIIPLHSPEEEEKKSFSKQDSEDGIYIPLQSPQKNFKAQDQKFTSQKAAEGGSKTVEQPQRKSRPKKREYEVCEDGSIIIPLHSPDEDKISSNFEDEIRKVDQELQKAREAAEKRLREEEEEKEKQTKPATLDFSDSESHISRLSQTYYSAKSEVPSGGSRTPSPGSTLSRKSSFASLFRKSDVFSSPDSQSGSMARKKSGTFTNFLKEASDGLRERSRSRSKSRECQSQSSSARSPSGKKNVFTNLFAKKKGDSKMAPAKENEQLSPRLDLQFTFSSENKKESDEGDYIIIPLRDPSQPSDSLDTELQEELAVSERTYEVHQRASSPLVILERSESPKLVRRERAFQGELVDVATGKSPIKDSLIEKRSPKTWRWSSESKELEQRFSEVIVNENYKAQIETLAGSKRSSDAGIESSNSEKTSTSKSPAPVKEVIRSQVESEPDQNGKNLDGKKTERLHHDSSLENEEKDAKEEILAVSDGGIRKLKLPPEPGDLEEDHERKGLVYQESFEDELPYVPTTLPLERPIGVHIVPVKHRVTEIKTCPIERPRSTTPINPTSLEDFVSSKETVTVSAEEKMKISLPRDDSITSRSKSPRRFSAKGKTWFEFAEAGLQSPRDNRKSSLRTTPSPPPLPPRSSPPSVLSSSAPPVTTSWINFEELPEKKKLPKRITTVPTLRSSVDGGEKSSASVAGNVVYSYVSPEDCQCECHEHSASPSKESDSKRAAGQKNDLMLELKSNHESVKKGFMNKNKTEKSMADNEKSECKDCESGRHGNTEQDTEETPLLDVSSDEENEDFWKKAQNWSGARSEPRLEVDKTSNLSDSSYDWASHEGVNDVENNRELKPFEMDLEVESDRSSLVSQDLWQSSDDNNKSLQ